MEKKISSSSYARSLLEASLDPLVTISAEGKITDVNKATELITGCVREKLIGSDFSDYFTEPVKAKAGYRKVFSDGFVKDYPLAIEHKSGKITYVLYNAALYRNAAGEIQGVFAAARDITERKEAEEKIKQASLYSRSLLEASMDPLVTISAEGKITDVNKATETATGCTRAELIGSDFSDYFTDPRKARAGYKEVFVKGFVRDYPLAIRHKSGEVTDVLYNATLFKNQAGVPQGVFAAARDVTEQKKAQEKLRNASLYARSLLEASLDPLVTISPDGKITDVNKATEDVTGCSREKLVGSDFSDYFTDPEKARVGYKQVLTEGFVKDYSLAIRHKTGKIVDVLYNASIYRNAEGEVQGVFAAARDVTDRKKAEDALRQSELKLRTVADFAYDLEYWMAPNGDMIYVSPSCLKFTGYSPEEFMKDPKLLAKIVHPDDKSIIGSHFDVVDSSERHEVDFRIITRDGAVRWMSHACQPVFDGNGQWIGRRSSNRDITNRKIIEGELRQTMEKLKQSNSELEQFAYVASHDLQEPLRMVASYVQLLERRYKGKLDSDADEFIAYAVDGANRMRGLIDDLLTYSRVSRLGKPFEPVDLESAIAIVLQNLNASIVDTKAVVTHDPLPRIDGDRGQIVQLFQNLIGNSIKFHCDESPRVHVSVKDEESEYLFAVKDNGIGIDPQYFDRLFKIFQRLHTKQEYPGSGIGLVICKKIVERHGGRIWLDSQVGKGSTVYFTLKKTQSGN